MSGELRAVMDEVATLEKACPICGSDLKGNSKYMFFCKKCNVLFR